jgi:uncharacterized protein YcbX
VSGALDHLRISQLFVHPVKSCAGIAVNEALLIDTGFEFDRTWMVVDAQGEFLSQREHPRLALVSTKLRTSDLMLKAPGMLALHLQLDAAEGDCRVRVWDDALAARDMGDLAAQWMTTYLGVPARLARFDPDVNRYADQAWCKGVPSRTAFADGFPLLVVSTASLAELNRRLVVAGQAPVTMERFRPNIVLDGLDEAHAEDQLDTLTIDSPDGPVMLQLVKPCGRCSIPDVDPATAAQGHAVTDVLGAYRAHRRIGGALAFGMNAIVIQGEDCRVTVGSRVQATPGF